MSERTEYSYPMTRWPGKKDLHALIYQANIFLNDLAFSVSMKFAQTGDPRWGSGLIFWAKSNIYDFWARLICRRPPAHPS
jgi:hypothetical protein